MHLTLLVALCWYIYVSTSYLFALHTLGTFYTIWYSTSLLALAAIHGLSGEELVNEEPGLAILYTLAPSWTHKRHEVAVRATSDAMRLRGPGGHHVEVV